MAQIDHKVTRDPAVNVTAFKAVNSQLIVKYPAKIYGCSWSDADLTAHLHTGESTTIANTAMTGVENPAVTDSGLVITTNVGTLLVDDEHTVVADGSEITTIKISMFVNDTSGAIEAVAFEKTTGEYGSDPAGSSFICDLKEYTCPASGASLTEINDWT